MYLNKRSNNYVKYFYSQYVKWRWYQSVEWWINIFLFSPRYIGHDTSNVRKIYRILWKGITMISIRRHDRIEKCCQRERSNYVVNSVVGFWNRRTWSGKRSERRKEGKEKTAEGCRKRVDGGKKEEGETKGGCTWPEIECGNCWMDGLPMKNTTA